MRHFFLLPTRHKSCMALFVPDHYLYYVHIYTSNFRIHRRTRKIYHTVRTLLALSNWIYNVWKLFNILSLDTRRKVINESERTWNSNVLFHVCHCLHITNYFTQELEVIHASFFPSSHPAQIMYGVIRPKIKPSVLLHVSLSTIGIIDCFSTVSLPVPE
jgi:hypothetical protein